MPTEHITRRHFLGNLSRMAAAGGIALQLPWLSTLAGCARSESGYSHLTRNEGRAMRAFAAQIIPSDDGTPGAEEAGAVYFVDRALGRPLYSASLPVIRAGLADLDERAAPVHASAVFATLSNDEQITIMRRIEHTPFFATARTLVITGTFADASYGGNRNGAGWTMLGIDHQPSYAAPFGWYDARTLAAEPRTGTAA
ncbi:MAG: gluconate 2-dehydrogenase subunit 3 family protein [bacterium]